MFLLLPARPGSPGQMAIKRLCVYIYRVDKSRSTFFACDNVRNKYLFSHFTFTGWAKKAGCGLTTIILSNVNRFKKIVTGRFLGKFAVKWVLKIPPHLACVAALPCETLTSVKQAIMDKLQILRLLAVWWPGVQSARDNHILACNFAKYSPILKMFSLTDSAINLS